MLNLHRVSPEPNDFYPPLHPRLLEQLVVFLARHFWLPTFGDDVWARVQDRPVAILSFDDGFHDFVEYAVPILEEHNIRANLNVIVGSVITGERPWTQQLNDFLWAAPRSLLEGIRLPGFGRRLTSDAAEERARYGAALSRFLKERSRESRAPLWGQLESIMRQADVVEPTRMMNLDEVREVAARHEVGAHSYEHESMEYESMAYFEEDLRRCRESFERMLGRPLSVYAFPNGSYREEHIDRLRADPRIRAILLVGDRFARPAGPVYPRFNVSARTLGELRLEALGLKAQPLL